MPDRGVGNGRLETTDNTCTKFWQQKYNKLPLCIKAIARAGEST